MNEYWVNIIQEWLMFKTYREIQMFLRFVNFYQQFVKDYFKIINFLTELLKENVNERKSESFQ